MSNRVILCVDDEQMVLNSLKAQIKKHFKGLYDVEIAESAEEALEIIEEVKDDGGEVVLVISDQIMPGMKGDEMLSEIHKENFNMIKILLTGQAGKENIYGAIENANLFRYLSKPWDEIDLILTIERGMEKFDAEVNLEGEFEDKQRMISELDLAADVQYAILPRDADFEKIKGLDIHSVLHPADEVGGDYYDVIDLKEDGILFSIGDVTGHGLMSGFLMLMAQSIFRTLSYTSFDIENKLDIMNKVLYRNVVAVNTDKNMTLGIAHYLNGKITVTGQHEVFIIVRSNGDVEIIDTDDLGMIIGISPDIDEFIDSKTFDLDKDDLFVLFTDGVTEAINSSKEEYGLDRFLNTLVENRGLTSKKIISRCVSDILNFIGDEIIYDDVTMTVIKF